jgi:hypothetical protein
MAIEYYPAVPGLKSKGQKERLRHCTAPLCESSLLLARCRPYLYWFLIIGLLTIIFFETYTLETDETKRAKFREYFNHVKGGFMSATKKLMHGGDLSSDKSSEAGTSNTT